MPLLRKQPFQRLHVSSDFKDDDEVFHCQVTNEIFKDYNEFCERIILCNSLIWSCCITGRSNMTYEEALQCEENAKRSLKEFPMELRIPILYLASKTNRSSFNEMAEDVFLFAKDRYFVGEMVEASFTEDSWCECHVLQVIAPSEQQIKAYMKENSPQEQHYHPSAKLFRYEVEQLDCGDSDVSQLMIVEAAQVRRKKQQYSRERNKIFLRQLCEQNETGIWIVKDSVLQKYGISKVRFDTIFTGPPPDYTSRVKKPIKHKQESIEKFLTANISKPKTEKKPDPLKKVNQAGVDIKKSRKPRMNGKFKEELKAKALEEKAKLKEENRELRKEQKLKLAALAAYVKQWNKPREDLECENLAPIPQPVPVKTIVSNDKFGDCCMILEFLEFFNEELEVNSYFSGGFTLDLLEKALLAKEASGPWSDLLQLLLSSIFKFQSDEEDEIRASDTVANDNTANEGVSSLTKGLATYHGCKLSELTLDHTTLSEILRQHLLSSGERIGEAASKWRYSQRGGYTNEDDPAFLMKTKEAHILRQLSNCSVHEFNFDDKLKIAACLINQLLTFASVRDVIEERHEKVHLAKKELRSFVLAEQKREKEEKEKMREREKDKEPKTVPKKITRGNCEEEKKKEEYETKLKELQQASKDDQMMLYLGSDRAYRRYWRLLSIPGIFVENDGTGVGTCLPEGTPYQPGLQDRESTYEYLRNKFEDEFSDKENSFKKAKKSPKKVTFSDKNGLKSPRKEIKQEFTDKNGLKSSPRKDVLARKEMKQEFFDVRKNLMACTGDNECPVHRQRPEPQWSFFGTQGDIEALIDSLNSRGIREGELRNNIVQEMTSLISIIEECPRHKLNPEVFSGPIKEPSNKTIKKNKYENANLNYPPDVPIEEVFEFTLRDFILELEDKIKAGCLGSLKVNSRDAWRRMVRNRLTDQQCDKLVYDTNEVDGDSAFNVAMDKVKGESDSEANTMDTMNKSSRKVSGLTNETEPVVDNKQIVIIKDLANAISQLYHAIDQKYLGEPLVNEKDKKHPGDDHRARWEQSLLASTSWSQLFLHLNTLENSISWAKSVLNAQCYICRRRRDAEKMLLCDGCNNGHHLYCLKPKLVAVPDGDWYCKMCKPPTKSKSRLKKRKKFEDELEEEDTLTKETRHNRAKRIFESEEEFHEDEDFEDENYGNINSQINVCSACRSGGKLINCDLCSNCYHMECIEPPIARPPRGRWTCSDCKDKKDKRSNIKPDSSNSEDTEPRQTRRAAKRAAVTEQFEDKGSIKGCMTRLQDLLTDVVHHKDSWPFLSPVTKDEVPDYHDIISNPMDFGTIKSKLSNGVYETLEQFFSDCHLIFNNCRAYNEEHSAVYNYVYRAGMRLLKYLEKRCKELGLNYDEDSVGPSVAKKQRLEENGVDSSEDEETEELQKTR
ncbi:ATP-dependent chromatin assembly factor large subunit isoform X3 [Lasioglossum baleicum]|uniref:ATP-dependent chromatin assembly factor large subunit isoform X3 n=1 Tax=Lasioglossum baleicum TaxID=434251 RepID=UPI003FCC4907